MNSSVTLDSATSVMSSLCLAIRLSSRSNGPSKLSRRTSNAGRLVAGLVRRRSQLPGSRGGGHSSVSRRTRTLSIAVGVEVGQHQRDRLADQPAAVDGQPVVAAQRQPRVLDVEQLVGGDVDGHLLVVPDPATRTVLRPAASDAGRARPARGPARAEQVALGQVLEDGVLLRRCGGTGRRPWAGSPVVARFGHRASTSLASWR